jgi:membrane-bound lytic murein transglycosylase D
LKYPLVAALAAVTLSACGRSSAPASAPAPVSAPSTATSTDDIPGPAQSAGQGASAVRDSVAVADSDVTREAVEVFGDSASIAPADSASADSSSAIAGWDMDVRSYETKTRVAHFVNRFSGSGREGIRVRLERGSRYDDMIRAKFRAGGIPEDMSYLALIESGYNPNAYSRAAAVGMWQFMSSTATGLGLRVDWWVDERRDPVRSTDAAVRFIRYLREQFGSLYLAAAAYNGGPGRISRGLKRFGDDMEDVTGEDRFFALAEEKYLPRETKDYVPQLIAVALVAREPQRYGIEIERLPPFTYDSVKVPATTPVALVARTIGASIADMRDLNPHVLRGVTPPKKEFWLRVPSGSAAGFDSAWAEVPDSVRKPFRRVVSKKGESLGSIAAKHKLTARELSWYNPKIVTLKPSGRLAAGQTILVPTRLVVSAAADVPDPSLELYGSAQRGRLVTHVVRKGESLYSIARKYRTTVKELKRVNGLRKETIFPGQSIVVRGSATPVRAAKASTKKRSAKPTVAGTARTTTKSNGAN